MKALACFALLALLGPPLAVAADPGALADVPPGVVDGATGRRLAKAGAVVLDVRTPEEFAAGHVPGAKNIPVDQVAARVGELGPPSTPVVVYCRSGKRSAAAIQTLSGLGFQKLWNAGGYEGWPKGP